MQVSLYLDEKVVKKIDEKAKKEQRSRSALIQSILEHAVFGDAKLTGSIADLAGSWEDDRSAEEIVDEVYKARGRNRRAERRSK
jgi:hypothetical protein